MPRILLGLCLVGAAGAAGFLLTDDRLSAAVPAGGAGSGRAPVAVAVETVPVASMRFADTVEAVGTTRARQSVVLQPSASGRVTEIGFAAGDKVEAGAVLLRLEDDVERAALASAEATLAEAEAALDRQVRLERSGSSSEAALDTARAAQLRAEAARDMALAELRDRSLPAPFAGVVGLTGLSRGQMVDSGTEVATLDDLGTIEVAFSVPERFLSRLAPGQAVTLASPAWPGTEFRGRLAAMDTRVDPATRSLALRAEVPNGDGRLRPGMFLRVSLLLSERSAQAVPERALQVSGAQSFVHLAENGTARRVEVATGAQDAGMVEIGGGLPDGAQVIVTNLHRISDGTAVEVLPLAAAGAAP
ncbi:efflux RND transporter periplasmic adaptor subunit [Mangrovicoccus sp. HB161399]|uniref:efflux RND transporter periplasmic adaptor subunit n=1 Tax=Mangrovicoccus sp. HB161399 TaxID=2720392 RepID=UPI0015563066|nr:efflux RND transporter periplasmic adaptor subunit [Mangrovicoccus sp. HB161399]